MDQGLRVLNSQGICLFISSLFRTSKKGNRMRKKLFLSLTSAFIALQTMGLSAKEIDFNKNSTTDSFTIDFDKLSGRDPLRWCTFLPHRDRLAIKDRIFELDPPFTSTAGILDILTWLEEAARKESLLIIDERYGSCLGCMNSSFGAFIETLEENDEIVYGVADFENITGLELDRADNRRPYNSILIEEGYKFVQALTYNKYQALNHFKRVESYPLVSYQFRDKEPLARKEDQPKRIYTRPHFPNLLIIDGKRIHKAALNNLCLQAARKPIRFTERPDGIHEPTLNSYKEMVATVLPYGALLAQMIGPNLYFTGSEDAADFNDTETIETIQCLIERQKTGGTSPCYMFVRPGFPGF